MFLLLLLPAVALATSIDNYVLNGEDVDIADFPFQGSYRTAVGSHTCGCVFVGANWVLTAGHCGGTGAYTMRFGGTYLGTGTVFGITAVTRHPNYGVGPGYTPNDISVVTASSSISGNNISPATVPTTGNPGGNGWITGWGRTCGGCAISVTLQGRNMPIISDAECTQRWGGNFQASNMLCVYDGEGAACGGDSGGPLSVENTVYGICSYGATECDASFPSVYARVGAFYAWVCSVTSNGAQGC